MAAPRLIRDSLPVFNLSDDQVLKKVFLSQLSSALLALPPSFQTEGIVAQVNQSFFALPFLHQEGGNKSIDTIAQRLRDNGYTSTNEVFADLDGLFVRDEAETCDKNIRLLEGDVERRFCVKNLESASMAEEMRKKLALWISLVKVAKLGRQANTGPFRSIFSLFWSIKALLIVF